MRDLKNDILALKDRRDVYIIAHYYQRAEIQDIADFVGDSYAMALAARQAGSPVIMVAGVDFMAESAAILCPDKIVISPEPAATCPMANSVSASEIMAFREENPGAIVVSYVNTTAAVKAVSDVCCTSSNAQKIVERLPRDRKILFIPDHNLGMNIQNRTGRKMEYLRGGCPIHAAVAADSVRKAQQAHPGARTLVHPECSPEVVGLAVFAGSPGGILEYIKASPADEFIIGTEQGIFHPIELARPEVKLYLADPDLICTDMKLITLDKILLSLETLETRIMVPEEIAAGARRALEKMIALAG